MSETEQQSKCKHLEPVMAWLKVVDNWSVGGFQNKFPRMYYVVAVLLLAVLL